MCGIFGIINKEEAPFDYSTFCVLGINNDSRGGDSCGVFMDGEVEYGVDKEKLFADFIYKSTLVQTTDTCKIALGHCRKASVGNISLATAQPVCIYNKDNKIEFVVIHNGTIHNYLDLAKKYIPEIDITGLTDSQVMARIFYYKGFDVLGEYCGGAVFVVVDYRKGEPRVYFFKGSSPKNSYAKEFTEERPFFISKSDNELVFSSIRTYLEVLRPNNELRTIAPNTLIGLKEGKLYRLREFDRKACYQDKPVKYANYYGYSGYSGYSDDDDDEVTVFTTCHTSRQDQETNRYLVGNKLINGKFWMGKYGTLWVNKPQNSYVSEMWFFYGIAIPTEEAYNLILRMYKKFDLDDPELFIECYENIIRYLSFDQLYYFDKSLVKATSATSFENYNGEFQMIGCPTVRNINHGKITSYKGCQGKYPELTQYPTVDIKNIKKIWRPLMK